MISNEWQVQRECKASAMIKIIDTLYILTFRTRPLHGFELRGCIPQLVSLVL